MGEDHRRLADGRQIVVSSDRITCGYPKLVVLVDENGYLHTKRCATAEEHDAFADEVFKRRQFCDEP